MATKKNIFALVYVFGNIRFLLSASVLIICAVALNPAISALSQYYGKKSAPIRKPLKNFDVSKLASFRDDWKSKQVSAPVKDLQTDEYVHLVFLTDLKELSRRVELLVTYYNDPADKVGHTPEVCARQEGAVVTELSTITIKTPQLAPDFKEIVARFIVFKQKNYYYADIYVFLVEGKFRHTRNQVRWVLGMPGNQQTYFSKIEAGAFFFNPEGRDEAVKKTILLLQEALPELLAEHFPTAQQIKRH